MPKHNPLDIFTKEDVNIMKFLVKRELRDFEKVYQSNWAEMVGDIYNKLIIYEERRKELNN